MKCANHFIYVVTAEQCTVVDFHYATPIEFTELLDDPVRVYDTNPLKIPGCRYDLEERPSIISSSGLLYVSQVVEPGDVVTIDLRIGGTVEDLFLRQGDVHLLLPMSDRICLWVTAGSPGVLVIKAKHVDDKGTLLKKLQANQRDLPLREYLTQQVLADVRKDQPSARKWNRVLTRKEACEYLRISESTFDRNAQKKGERLKQGQIPRLRTDNFLLKDLIAWENSRPRRAK